MVDESLYSAGFLKEKKEDIDFLQGIDYKALQKKADKAIASGSAQQIHEAVAEIDSYDDQVNRERSTVPVPHLDQKIQACVDKYNAIQSNLREGIEGYLQNTKTSFNKEYNAKSPKIAKLRKISEDYSTFENKVPGLDDLIIQYSGFSKALRSVETEISGTVEEYKNAVNKKQIPSIVEEYKNITTKKQLQAVEQRIRQSGKKIEKIKSNAPKKGIFGLGGIHKAYNYRNDTLARLSLETIRFEKEGFAKKRQQAKKEIAVAEDFIDFLQCANDEEVFTVFEDYAKLAFSDVSSFVGTIYFSEVAKDHSANLRNLRKIAREQALECKEKSIEGLNEQVDRILNDTAQPIEYFQNQQTIIGREYRKKSSILGKIIGSDRLEGDSFDDAIQSNLARIDQRIASIHKRSAREEELRLKAEKIRSNAKLRKAKDEFAKKEQTYQRQQKESQKKIEEIAKEKSTIARRLEENEKKRKDLQGRVGQLNQQYTQLQGKIDQSSRTLAQELTAQFRKELEDVKKAYSDTDQTKKKDYAVLKAQLDQLTNGIGAMEQNIQSVSTESAEKINHAYQDLKKEIAKKPNLSEAQLQQKLKPLYAKMDQVTDMTKAEKKSILLEIYDRLFGKKEEKKEQPEKPNKSSEDKIDLQQILQQKHEKQKNSSYTAPSTPVKKQGNIYLSDIRKQKERVLQRKVDLQELRNKKYQTRPVANLSDSRIDPPVDISMLRERKNNIQVKSNIDVEEIKRARNQNKVKVSASFDVTIPSSEDRMDEARQESFDLIGELENMPYPEDNLLFHARRMIVDGNGLPGLAARIRSLGDLINKDAEPVKGHFDIEWLKELRSKLVEEIKYGIIGHHADNNGLKRNQYFELIANSIDPYIAKCEAALLTKV